jgi:hypothetical protein
LKFKGFRFEMIFNLNAVFTTHVLKVAPIRVRFSPGFPPGAGFPGEQSHEELTTWVKTGFSRLQRGARSTPDPGALLSGLRTRKSGHSGKGAGFSRIQCGTRSTLEQISLREILLLEEIPSKSAHGLAPFLKSAL